MGLRSLFFGVRHAGIVTAGPARADALGVRFTARGAHSSRPAPGAAASKKDQRMALALDDIEREAERFRIITRTYVRSVFRTDEICCPAVDRGGIHISGGPDGAVDCHRNCERVVAVLHHLLEPSVGDPECSPER